MERPNNLSINNRPTLKRSLTLSLVVLYGLGTTIGAGIYVLIGATAARAGLHAPLAFVIAALVMVPSACSFGEFVGRLPVSAGEAAYVRQGFRSQSMAIVVGLLVVTAGTVSAAAISVGCAGYLQVLVALPEWLLISLVVILMGAVAGWGILKSVGLAALLTLIEIAGLLFVIVSGLAADPYLVTKLPQTIPASLDTAQWAGILGASLLAFFAFVGFEDLVNIAEETERPAVTLPWAIFITLGVTTLLYVLVASVAVLMVPIDDLARAKAPLSLVFERVAEMPPLLITLIAIVATLNGIVVQIIMASRILYGLGRQGYLPAGLGVVHSVTRTPLLATFLVVVVILLLALLFPLAGLAEMTARITLTVFGLVNLALFFIKQRGEPAPDNVFVVWTWVPVLGVFSCALMLAAEFL